MNDAKPSDAHKDALFLAAERAFAKPFDAVLELRPDDGQSIWVDGRANPPGLLREPPKDSAPACCWRGPRETLQRALANSRAFDSAYLSGRLSVSGDIAVMARLELEGR